MRFRIMPAALCAGLTLLQGCGGSGSGNPASSSTATSASSAPSAPSAPQSSAPASITAPSGSTVVKVSVNLASGSPQALQSLTLANSIGAVSAGPSGAFELPIAGSVQLAEVTDTSGTDVALGFVSPDATTIDATSTAKALVYFAAGFYILPDPYRAQIVDDIATSSGFGAVVNAVTTAMAQGGIGSTNGAPQVSAALKDFVTTFYDSDNTSAAATEVAQGRAEATAHESARVEATAQITRRIQPHNKSVAINPSDAQSGITVVNDFSGVHFQNSYRRLAKAFFDEVSYKDASGNTVAKAVADVVAPVQVPAETGLTTVTGTLVTAVQALGSGDNTSGVYTPVSTSTVALALEPNSTDTRYQITVVGAGRDGATLTAEQQTAHNLLAAQQLLQDFLTPIISSILIPINGKAIDTASGSSVGNAVYADFISTLTTTVPQVVDQMNQGNVDDALWTAFNAIAQSNTLQTQILNDLQAGLTQQISAEAGQEFEAKLAGLLKVLNGVSYTFVAADILKTATDIGNSHAGDVFTVDVVPNKVTLSPTTSTVSLNQTVQLTAAVPGADTTGFSYQFSTTGQYGTISGSGGSNTTSFCASNPNVTYLNTTTPDSSVTNPTDTVSVTVFSGSNCKTSSTATQVGQAAVSVSINPASPVPVTVNVSPTGALTLEAGQSLDFTASVVGGQAGVTYYYSWEVSSAFGTLGGVAVNETDAANSSLYYTCSANPGVTFTASPPFEFGEVAGITVTVFTDPACTLGDVGFNPNTLISIPKN